MKLIIYGILSELKNRFGDLFGHYFERAMINLDAALKQYWTLLLTFKRLWWGGLMLVIYVLIVLVLDVPVAWTLSPGQYMKGILTILMLAWVLLQWSHVLKRESYVVGDDGDAVETFEGNANWISVVLSIIVTGIFWLLGTPQLALIILGVVQIVPFFLGEDYQEQSEFELPKLANFALVALSIWIVAFR